MDILNRKLLSIGDTCYFYVSSVESPYFYIRFKGVVKDLHTLKEEQVVYRIEPTEILELYSTINTYINRSSFRVFDINRKVNRTKLFYTFDVDNSEIISKCFDNQFLLECPSASVFEVEKNMQTEFKNLKKYIIELLSETIKQINDRV